MGCVFHFAETEVDTTARARRLTVYRQAIMAAGLTAPDSFQFGSVPVTLEEQAARRSRVTVPFSPHFQARVAENWFRLLRSTPPPVSLCVRKGAWGRGAQYQV
jgi:hypothetical protein